MSAPGKNKMKKVIFFDLDGTLLNLTRLLDSKKAEDVYISSKELQILGKRFRLGLITGATREEVNTVFDILPWRDIFETNLVLTKDEISLSKASGVPFAVGKFLASAPCVMIGDSKGDWLGCKRANLRCFLVKEGNNLQEVIRKAKDSLRN